MAALNVQIDNQIRARGDKDFANNAGHIPCFYDDPKVDTMTAKLFITKIDENISNGWVTAENMFLRLPTVLKGDAKLWFDALVETNRKPDDWPQLRAKFIKDYRVTLTSLVASENIGKLCQNKNESVLKFSARVTAAIGEMYKSFELSPPEDKEPFEDCQAALHTVDPNLALRNRERTKAMATEHALENSYKFKLMLIKSFFVIGLLPELKNDVLSRPNLNFEETLDYAAELEAIKKPKQNVSEIPETPAVDPLDLKTTVAAAVAAAMQSERSNQNRSDGGSSNNNWRSSNNQNRSQNQSRGSNQPSNNNGNRNQNGNNKGSNSYKNATCWYCKNNGHLQTRCFKRIADRKPLVTKNNKVFLINGADVIPERGITSEEISACKDAKIQGYCNDQDFQ